MQSKNSNINLCKNILYNANAVRETANRKQ